MEVETRKFNGKQSPQLVLYSKSGVIPYLNWNYVRKHRDIIYQEEEADDAINLPTLVYLGDLADLYDKIKTKDESLRFEQSALLDHVDLVVNIFDPLGSYGNHKSTTEAIPFTCHQGKRMIDVPMSLDMIDRCVVPKYFQALADVNAPPEAKSKWTTKVVKRSGEMLERTLEQSKAIDSKILGSVTGGYDLKARLESCRALQEHSDKIAGVVIESFYGYHKTRDGHDYFEDVYNSSVDRMLRETIYHSCQKELPRAMFGVFMPDDMLRLVAAGIDVLDTSVCTLLTQQGMALPSPLIDHQAMRLRFGHMTIEEIREHSGRDEDTNPSTIIDLNHAGYNNSHIPISSRCECHVCGHGYSRAYLNHLLKRRELNASMLLQIHNHWSITHFMAQVRGLVRHGLFETFLVNSNLNPS